MCFADGLFAGDQSEIYAALSWLRSQHDGFPNTVEGAANCFRAHLHRGLGFLASGKKKKTISDFIEEWI
jgi:DNA sulfur modification protein DndE